MADKKISALTAVADADIGGDDLLHIVDNPGGTPVNKKMTIAQLFENIRVQVRGFDHVAKAPRARVHRDGAVNGLFPGREGPLRLQRL